MFFFTCAPDKHRCRNVYLSGAVLALKIWGQHRFTTTEATHRLHAYVKTSKSENVGTGEQQPCSNIEPPLGVTGKADALQFLNYYQQLLRI
jgi:hypothetical protein